MLVLPSRTEGVPRAVLEARSCRLPVVVSNLDQFDEVLEASCRTVDIGAAEQIADSIVELLGSGSDHCREVSSWDRTVQETTAILSSIARED